MTAPLLAVGDGSLGFWRAVRDVFSAAREQRCWFHKQANALAALPKSAHPGALSALKGIYNAEDIDKAQLAIKAFAIDYGAKYPKAPFIATWLTTSYGVAYVGVYLIVMAILTLIAQGFMLETKATSLETVAV
jgi:transposase-like protein